MSKGQLTMNRYEIFGVHRVLNPRFLLELETYTPQGFATHQCLGTCHRALYIQAAAEPCVFVCSTAPAKPQVPAGA
jgi:hypothetical protein